MNEEEDIRGGATDEQINQAYKEAKINEQKDPRTDEKFLEERAKENKIKGFDPSESMLDKEFEAQKELQEDDVTAEQEFRDANRGIDIMYEVVKTADKYLGSRGALGQLFDFIKGKSEGKDVEFPVQLLLKEQKDLPKDDTKAVLPEGDETNFLSRVFSTGRGQEISEAISQYLQSMMTNYGIKGPKKNNPPPEKIRKILGLGGTEDNPVQLTLIEDFVNSIVNDEQQAGASYQTLTYGNINSAIEQLSEEDLTDEEKIKYAQQNAPESSIDIEDYVKNFGSSLISRKALHVNLVKPFQKKYGASDAAVERYVKLTNRTVKDIKSTIAYLNYKYKETLPTAEINDIAADMSLLFGQDITPETIDSIIKGQGGEILFQTQGMKNRKQAPFSIKTREDLLKVYNLSLIHI